MLIEREVGHHPFQSAILFLQLSQPPEFADAQVGVFLLPRVEGLLRDPLLPAEIANRSTRLDLPKGIDDLLLGEFRPLHGSTPFVLDRRSRYLTLVLPCRRFRGRRYLTSGAPAIGQSH